MFVLEPVFFDAARVGRVLKNKLTDALRLPLLSVFWIFTSRWRIENLRPIEVPCFFDPENWFAHQTPQMNMAVDSFFAVVR
jgi:hypothetical protein